MRTQVKALPDGCTHVYSFWQGINHEDRVLCAKLVNACPTIKVSQCWGCLV